MVDRFFELSYTTNLFRQGPLAGHVDAFASLLWEQGYSRGHGQIQLRLIGDLNQWLECKQLTAEQLDERVLARPLRHRKHSGPTRPECAFMLTHLLGMLRQNGVTPEQERHPVASPHEQILEQYRWYLHCERGLSALTVPNRLVIVDRFGAEKFPRDRLAFAGLKPRDVTGFVQRQAAEASAAGSKKLVTALRFFFRYLRHPI
jgi:integrase/recombinase XerD